VEQINVDILKDLHRHAIDSGSRDEASLRDAVRDEGALFFIAEGANRLTGPLERAAFLIHRIATRHPFYEGNKRTALLAAEDVLTQFGYCIKDSSELNQQVRDIAAGCLEEDEIISWLETVVVPIR